MRCTQRGNTTFIFAADIDSASDFVILDSEAGEHLFHPVSCRQIRSLTTEQQTESPCENADETCKLSAASVGLIHPMK